MESRTRPMRAGMPPSGAEQLARRRNEIDLLEGLLKDARALLRQRASARAWWNDPAVFELDQKIGMALALAQRRFDEEGAPPAD